MVEQNRKNCNLVIWDRFRFPLKTVISPLKNGKDDVTPAGLNHLHPENGMSYLCRLKKRKTSNGNYEPLFKR